ncbi:MAG: DNA (cytosine-5-)-methyltransferase [Alphaproteobacteria bacterium GM202ARS2]|nr:DNA (cytosine-5-)-methyltransferase [Alphaproteobacteria bacterium GM202ARS2]
MKDTVTNHAHMITQGNGQSVLTVAFLFAGIGNFCTSFRLAGFSPIWANELDDSACASFRFRHDDVNLYEMDIRELKVSSHDLQPPDVLVAGFPCQSFSQAGNRKGFSDPRGRLFYEIIRILGEFGENRPALLVLENVPYLLYGERGSWFSEIEREIRRAGYWFSSSSRKVMSSCDYGGIPQDRNRLFMVATSRSVFHGNPFRFPSSTKEVLPLTSFIDRSKNPGEEYYLPVSNKYRGLIDKEIQKTGNPDSIYQIRRYYARGKHNDRCPTLTANMGLGGHNVPFIKDEWGIRKLTVRECASLQGMEGITEKNNRLFPKNVPQNEQYRLIGNSVCVPTAYLLALECMNVFENMKNRKG